MENEFQFLIYRSSDENITVNAVIKDETIWLTQKSMAELFGVNIPKWKQFKTKVKEQ